MHDFVIFICSILALIIPAQEQAGVIEATINVRPPEVVETDRAQVLRDLQTQADKPVIVNQLDERLW